MADILKKRYDAVTIELIEGSGGVFEVQRDGELVFSKRQKGRFPEEAEIFEALDA